MNKIERARELLEKIKHYDRSYFTDDVAEISDEAYDELWFELRRLLEDSTVNKALARFDMPLGEQNSYLAKFQHLVPVLSLDKLKSGSSSFEYDLAKFMSRYPSDQWVIEPKFDGLTIVIYKQVGHAPVFVTRGAGQKGENVTAQFEHIVDVHRAAVEMPDGMVVKGEALMSKQRFAEVCGQDADNDYSHPRNLASASLRTLDVERASVVGVTFMAYEMLGAMSSGDQVEDLNVLSELGFMTTQCECVDNEKLIKALEDNWLCDSFRDAFEWPIDGVVIKPLIKPAEPKITGHHLKGETAIKFPPSGAVTRLIGVDWTISRNKRMTPVAVFEPIEINGSAISRASFGSYQSMCKFGITTDCKIYVVLSNDVIPHVDAVIEDISHTPVEIPDGSHLEGAIVICDSDDVTNDDVVEAVLKFMHSIKCNGHHLTRNVLGKIVTSLSITTVAEFIISVFDSSQHVDNVTDDAMSDLREHVKHCLENARLADVITGLDIKNVGHVKAQAIAALIASDGMLDWDRCIDQELRQTRHMTTASMNAAIGAVMARRDDITEIINASHMRCLV